MKIVVVHNDLRVYWRRRLMFLRDFLGTRGIDLYAVELFGKGSPYDFESFNKTESWWDCIFPENSHHDLTSYQIKEKLFSKLDEINPDIVIGGSIVFYSGALGLRWAKKNKKKFIMFDDGKPSWVKRNFVVQGIKNLITNQIDALWLPSDEYDKDYVPLYSKERIPYLYGYDCIDNNLFAFAGEKRFDNKKIISVARLVPKKNIQALLEAWKFVEDVDYAYELVILGDGLLYEELKNSAKSLGLQRVTFLGAVSNDDIPRFLFEADAFISPSLYESWGLVVNEAAAAGLPLLLSDKINAAFTLLKDGENGYIFDPYNQSQIKEKLLGFINLPDSVKKSMSVKSLEIINTLGFDYMGNQLLDTLNFLKNQPSHKGSFLPRMLINLWYGRYTTIEWDNVKPV